MGNAYVELLDTDRDYLMLQHQAYAACDDAVIRDRVRASYARLVAHVEELRGAEPERIDEFFRYGMWLNVAAAMGVEDLSVGCEWVREERRTRRSGERRALGKYSRRHPRTSARIAGSGGRQSRAERRRPEQRRSARRKADELVLRRR